jgi:[protein-PII] uridylyltransferase
LNVEVVDSVAFLVREHLLLIKTATRRDIYDEETALIAARKIKDIERLKMLYLLTVADSTSTGPMAWNQWKAALLRDFFLKVLNVLDKGELATAEAVEIVEQKKKTTIATAGSNKAQKHTTELLEVMSPRYLLYTPADAMTAHIKLYDRLGNHEFVWDIKRSADADTRTVTICAKDRPGLISKMAGVYTLHNIDILDVQVFTWRNNIALDIFEVKPPPDKIMEAEQWKRTEKKLGQVLADKTNLASALKKKVPVLGKFGQRVSRKPHRVRVDNKSSSFFTIIEVFTYDFPGLLFNITDALFRCALNIWVAKIATKADQVVDVFYVWDLNGQKIDEPDQVAEIKTAILGRLPKM